MTTALVQTKLCAPPLRPSLVPRPQLVDRLNSGLAGKLTLVSAPAGFGKTTLVVNWLSAAPDEPTIRSSAWLSLDAADNDPIRFFTYLATALTEIDPGLGQAIAAPLRNPGPPSPEALVSRLVNETVRLDQPFIVTMDDYHHIDSPHIHGWLATLLEHQPEQMHLVVVTREDPPLPLARLRGRGELTDIRQEDLSFTIDETATFLNDLMGLNLTPAEIAALETRTEGWIAGLQLAALSMRGRDDVSQFIQSFTGSNRYIMEYLIEEVFQQQPAAVQRFLLKTAVLDLLSGPLCDALLDTEETGDPLPPGYSQSMLEYLDGANLFVVPLDDERCWFRYHHLFADLLRHRLQQEGEEPKQLHDRASRWFEANGLPAEAIEHALAAGDWPRLASLIEAVEEEFLQRGQISTMLRWLQALPEEIIHSQPTLCFSAAWVMALSGRTEAAQKYIEIGRQLAEGQPELKGQILVLQAHIARIRHDASETITLSEQALTHLAPDDFNARSIVGVNLGAAYIYTGNFERAVSAWEDAVQAGQLSGNFHTVLLSLTFMGQVRAAWGQLHQAADYHRQAIRLGMEQKAAPVTARAHVNLARLLYEWNDLAQAGQHLEQALQLSRLASDQNAQRDAYRLLARLQQAKGDVHGALTAVRQAQQLAGDEAPDNAILATAISHLQLALAQGDLARAGRWLARIEQQPVGRECVRMDLVANAACLSQLGNSRARYLLAQDRRQEAADLLTKCYQAALEANLVYALANTRFLQALCADDTAAALDFLAKALAMTEAEEYCRTYLDEGDPALRLLRLAYKEGIRPAYTAKLLTDFEATPSGRAVTPGPIQTGLVDPLSRRELEILALVAKGHTNAEVARTLVVSPNTVKTHLQRIYEKLAVHNRRAAVARARELNLLG